MTTAHGYDGPCVVAGRGTRGHLPHSPNFSVLENFPPKFKKKMGMEISIFFWGGDLGAKLKFRAPIISCVENLQVSVGKLQLAAPTDVNPNPRLRCLYRTC